ncbi:unnamed protein product (macronuclear) [Paramecium tetraurelia]|uniref:Uncharacterized protein n=1 Tax=Paramecium tetraurelia TaxID=5888 RepID=A0EDY5_PARTE|nr:uncharacterized protein GSPATT00025846001 [Paramecium tetraurelia]CAK93502.1 unnamed protein product [Paramecium tetraurelia]|eukprot:XP_001460899.1 hypothetical protein (macronuclear) [Paramecium tetraurelia strain d4-2]
MKMMINEFKKILQYLVINYLFYSTKRERMQQGCDENFEINEVVWAKVLGCKQFFKLQIHGGQHKQLQNNHKQISSISNGKTGTNQQCRVNFLADGTHADLRLEKVKKWDDKPAQMETKKLKEAIELANQILTGQYQNILPSFDNLNEHALKSLVIKLNDLIRKDNQMDDIAQLLNKISNVELLSIVKMNLGQQLFRIHKTHQSRKPKKFQILLNTFLEQLTTIIGYKEQVEQTTSNKKKFKQSISNEEPLEEITKCVIIQDGPEVKRKKAEESFQNTPLNQ